MRILSEFIQEDTKILTIQIGINEEIVVKKKKRSKNANSYFWELLTQLCQELNLDLISEYKKRVKELGICQTFELDTKNVPTFVHLWEDKGIAFFTEKVEEIGNKTILNAYYGSSSYNSKQMSKLIDNLVQDCKEVGIQTLDELEIQELIRSEYDRDTFRTK
jgi:hypothetical protein